MDSYGNLCGTKNNWDSTNGPDLTFKKKLYYLNPLELLNPNTIQTAKAICVDECPTQTDVCGVADFPCRASNLYRYAGTISNNITLTDSVMLPLHHCSATCTVLLAFSIPLHLTMWFAGVLTIGQLSKRCMARLPSQA